MKRFKRCMVWHPMFSKQVRCEKARDHEGQHAHSFYARYWDA